MRPLELASLSYVIIDFETTGLEANKGDEIIEIGAVKVQNRQIVDKTFYSLVHPRRDLPAEATKVHGITEKDLKNAPYIEAVFPKFLEFIGQGVLVAQNAKFDLGFLLKNLGRSMISRFENPILDTMLLSRFIFSYESRHNLDAIVQRLQIDAAKVMALAGGVSEGRHRSLGDCYLTAQALIEMIGILEKRGLGDLKSVRGCLLKAGTIPIEQKPNMSLF